MILVNAIKSFHKVCILGTLDPRDSVLGGTLYPSDSVLGGTLDRGIVY